LKAGKKKSKKVIGEKNLKPAPAWLAGIEEWLTGGRVLGLMAVFSLLYTFPLVFSLGNKILGSFNNYYSDIFNGIWLLWISKYQLLNLHAFPFRYDMLAGPYSAHFFSLFAAHKSPAMMIPFTVLLGPVVSLNIYTLLNFVLAGFFTFMLVFELTGKKTGALLGGLIFAFCPYAYAQAVVHMDLGSIWPLPMVFWSFLRLERQLNMKNGLLLVAALALFYIYCSKYYYLFFPLAAGSWLLLRFVDSYVYQFQTGSRIKGTFSRITLRQWMVFLLVALVLVIGGLTAYVYYLGPMAAEQVRPIHWQERFKLSWANYLLPGVDHPLFGKATRAVVPIRRNVTESTGYIGWVPLVLALWGFRSARRDWRAWIFLIFGLAALSFTLGPYMSFGYIRLPMPSILLHKIAPFIRVISRYSVFLQLTVAVLAGYGMLRLIGMMNEKKIPALILPVLFLILVIEYLPPRESTVIAGSPKEAPPVYRYLAGLETDATVFEYPARAVTGNAIGDYLYFQTIHKKKLFNRHFETTTIPEAYLPFWWDLDYPGALSDPNNVALLSYFGVDYLVFHDRTGTETPTLPIPELKNIDGLEPVEDFGKSSVYRVVAEPAKVLHAFETRPFYNYLEIRRPVPEIGFEAPQVLGDGRGWRIMHERGRLTLHNLLEVDQKVGVELAAVSFQKPRPIQVVVDRQLRLEVTVGTSPQVLRIPDIELPPEGEVELIFNSPEGVSRLTTRGGGSLEASIALAGCKVIHGQ